MAVDPFDPARTAIFLLPLLRRPGPGSGSKDDVSLPSLAAGLSVLPPAIAAAFQRLGEEVKALREQQVERPPNQDAASSQGAPEARQRNLDQEKIQHLEQSLASLSSLHTSLQKRHLATVDALSDLQAAVAPSLDSLRDERDAQKAVNNVLRGTVTGLQAELADTPSLHEPGAEAGAEDVSDAGTYLCPFHQAHAHAGTSSEASVSEACTCGSFDATTVTEALEGPAEPARSRKDRAVHLVADLTEHLEVVRLEAAETLRSADRRAAALEAAVYARESELKTLMASIEDVMGLRGFVVQWPGKPEAVIGVRTRTTSGTHRAPPRATLPLELESEVAELEEHLRRLQPDEADLDSASLASGSTANPSVLSRALVDLSHQMTHLRATLRAVTVERDNLRARRGLTRQQEPPASSEASIDDRLAAVSLERDRFADLLKSAEAQIYSLQRQLNEQEEEFEQIADKVRAKLDEQKAKLERAHKEIDTLAEALEAAERRAVASERHADEEGNAD